MKTFKVQFVALAVLVGFTTVTVAPRPAHALIGIAATAYAVRTAGGITLLTGGVITGASLIYAATYGAATLGEAIGAAVLAAMGIAVGTVTAGIGLILLDGENGGQGSLVFQWVDPAKPELYAAAGVTAQQVSVYNTEVEELNAARETIEAEMNRIHGSLDDAHALWETYRSRFAPDTVTVASRLTDRMFARVLQGR